MERTFFDWILISSILGIVFGIYANGLRVSPEIVFAYVLLGPIAALPRLLQPRCAPRRTLMLAGLLWFLMGTALVCIALSTHREMTASAFLVAAAGLCGLLAPVVTKWAEKQGI